MTDKPTGVFVRFPLSEDQAHTFLKESSHAWDECNGSSDGLACTSGLLAIGTLVTGGEFFPIGYINEDAICGLATGVYQSASILREEDAEHYDTTALIRRSDAAALLAARDAEIARLRSAITKTSAALKRVTEERMTSYQAKNGRWVSIQGDDGERCDIIHSDVTTDCEAAIIVAHKALKGGAA